MSNPRAMVRAVEESAREARRRGLLTATELQAVVDAIRGTPARIRGRATPALADLAIDFPPARDAVLALAADRAWPMRFQAMHCLRQEAPREWAAGVVRVGLADRHFRVRYWAGVAALTLRLTEVVPDLERSLASESNQDVARYATGRALPLLRDGFRLQDDGGPVCVLDVLTPRGRIGRGVTRQELEERGLPALVAELQSRAS